MTNCSVSYRNTTDFKSRYIAACGGGSGKVVVWKMEHCWLDLPSACISYEGKILDIKIVQDKEREIGVLLTLHTDPNCLIITSLNDFKFIKKIILPCHLSTFSINPQMN